MVNLFPITLGRVIIGLWIITQLSSCATQNLFNGSAPATSKSKETIDSAFFSVGPEYQYTIRKDDKISISVWDHDELSVGSLFGIYNSNEVYGKWLMVNARGEINAPRIGPFHIQGLTLLQAQDSLKNLYAVWIRDPVIEVKVLNKEISMLGEFKTPGKVLLEKDNNYLLDMIAKAGDFDFYANKRKVKILRTVNNQLKQITIDLTRTEDFNTRNIKLIPGDVVYVPSKKGKDFEKRITTILPFVSIITAVAIIYTTFK